MSGDEVDRANEHTAQHNAACLAAHRAAMPTGPSAEECEVCGKDIPEERRRLAPGCTRCVGCQTIFEQGG